MSHDLGDVVVRARGLGIHLLSRQGLQELAHSQGLGALARALRNSGYAIAPSGDEAPLSAPQALDEAVDGEVQGRLDLLARWLGPHRVGFFAGVFDDEQRRALRVLLRRVVAPSGGEAGAPTRGTSALPSRLARALSGARDAGDFARVLAQARSPYAAPLAEALRSHGPDLRAADGAIDRTFARRGLRAAAALGGRLREWFAESIDLENAWDALLQGGREFLDGGTRLSRERRAAAAREADEGVRRHSLAVALGPEGLGAAFADPQASLATLEARVLATRIRLERRAARVEPLGAGPVLLVVLLLRAERAHLRRIIAGVAQRLPGDAIATALAEQA